MPEIVNVPIKHLKLLENNPRSINKEQFAKLMESLKQDPAFVMRRPCLVNLEADGTKRVYAGNQRVQAAKKLGWKEIPCIIDSNLDEETIKARIVKDNKTYGEFDFDILHNEWDIDILLAAGFSPEELTGDFGDTEVIENEEDTQKTKKLKPCPNCGFEF